MSESEKSTEGPLHPIVRAKIGPGVLCNFVFDHRFCIHGKSVKQQCLECLEILAENLSANAKLSHGAGNQP